MARLLVKLHGEDVSRLTLEDGIEYIAGRASDANIQLANERGISRHHLKFCQRNGVWVCESLSKFVLLQKGGASLDVIELNEPCVFAVAPYEFHFEPSPAASVEVSPTSENNLPVFYQPRTSGGGVSDDTSPGHPMGRANSEATMAGVGSNLVPYIRISFQNTADNEVLKLEGHLWVAGRDPNCEIAIDSAHVSRKHFELARTNEGFYLTDLGSSNGTKINGQTIPPHEPTRVESGDEISIKSVEMAFEIRDTNFGHRIENLPVAAFDPTLAAPPMNYAPIEYQESPEPQSYFEENQPVHWTKLRPHHLQDPALRTKAIRLGLVAVVVVMLGVFMMPASKKGASRDPDTLKPDGNTSVSFEKLSNEQRSVIKDSFSLARNLYVQGKYELCLTELAKVHELIPLFENSKELQSFCEQGKELVQRQRDLDRKERERLAIESQISGYVEACAVRLKNVGSVEETRQCLSEAMELDPEHHLIVEMVHTAQVHEEERKFLATQKSNENKKAAKGAAHYQLAQETYKEGHLAQAIAEYERFLSASYPRTAELKNKARRELASIKKEHKSKVTTQVDQCKALGSKGQYKEAFKACDRAVEEDPQNQQAKEERGHMLSELKRELKGIYEDSVLEESLGNVDSAKEKWKKIVKEDLEKGEYGAKARGKLQKYGVGN